MSLINKNVILRSRLHLNRSQHNEYTEAQLIAGLLARDEKTMAILYDRYSKALFTVAFRILTNQEMCEDVLQETFLKVWNNISQYDETKGTLFTWMLNICRNSAIDKVRSKEFKAIAKNQSISGNVDRAHPRTELNIDTLGLVSMTEKLNADQKEIIDLVYFKGYTHVEIAEKLDLPLGTVKTRLRSAIIELRNYFK